ncbi:S1/P1 nuclease [Lacipirellula parvula]|nr:S1/P1 nuclease [Lacipirellula parvula]
MRNLLTLAILLLSTANAAAWNALGHKVIADIAWQQLNEQSRAEIVRTLRRHPRFDDDFAKQMPSDVDENRWIFQQAAVWPDIARGKAGFDMPTWHYVNIAIGRERGFNFVSKPVGKAEEWNIIQAIAYCRKVIASDATPSQKALAYSWLFHLVGDLHQPMHSTALFSERFPDGDRGGNSIPLVQGDNLHSLWDNLLGRQHRANDLKREIAELKARPELWKVEPGDAGLWLQESHKLAKEFAYCPEILEATRQPGELAKIRLPASYLKASGEHARYRVVAAGLRLGMLLGGSAEPVEAEAEPVREFDFAAAAKPTPRPMSLTPSTPATSSLAHWLNTNGNVRHNSGCRWYHNTKSGRACSASEGKACGQCGG